MKPLSWLILAPLLVLPAVADTDYKREVKPIFEKRCVECHSAKMKKPKGGYKFDDDESIAKEIGPSFLIKPGDSATSTLMEMVNRTAKDHKMPPDEKDKLSPKELKTLTAWIQEGANMDKTTGPKTAASVLPEQQEWTSADGKKIKATLVKIIGDKVTLKMAGKDYLMPLSGLNEASQAQAYKLAGEQAVRGK